MRKALIALVVVVAFLISGCLTVPPAGAVGRAATPKTIGPESGYSGFGMADAHDWSDDDARTLLWLRSNLPMLWADIPFPIIKLFSYNNHPLLTDIAMPFDWSNYFADADDPMLLVRMLSVTSRDRNRTRQNIVLEEQAEERTLAERPVDVTISDLSDGQVVEKLLVIYP